MADDDQQEKTEQASAKRRQDYREKGQVAQSREVTTAALISLSLLLWYFYAPIFWDRLSMLVAELLQIDASARVTEAFAVNLGWHIVGKMALLLAPILLLTLVVGIVSSVAQIGWLFTTKPLAFDLSKLDPVKGAAKFVSKRSAVELIKSLAKVLLVGVVAYKAVAAEFSGALLLVDMPLVETLSFMGRVAQSVLIKSSGILILLGLLDFLYVRWEMEEKMKMTKQEQKEEHKETEGDPQIKSRVRTIQMQMARNRMMAEIPKADVIITNPTHLSVAISYRRGEMNAPQVVAKGADHLAMKIREIAGEHGVPLVENVTAARALYKVDIGSEVPEELFKAVAEILAYVYSLKGKQS